MQQKKPNKIQENVVVVASPGTQSEHAPKRRLIVESIWTTYPKTSSKHQTKISVIGQMLYQTACPDQLPQTHQIPADMGVKQIRI